VSFFLPTPSTKKNFWQHNFMMHTLQKCCKWTLSVQQNATPPPLPPSLSHTHTHRVLSPLTQNTTWVLVSHPNTERRTFMSGGSLRYAYCTTRRDTIRSTLSTLTSTSLITSAISLISVVTGLAGYMVPPRHQPEYPAITECPADPTARMKIGENKVCW
jgi:hypothetical protein